MASGLALTRVSLLWNFPAAAGCPAAAKTASSAASEAAALPRALGLIARGMSHCDPLT
jgi:hypothetical protein